MPAKSRNSNKSARRLTIAQWQAELLPSTPYETSFTLDVGVIGFAFESQRGVHAFASDRKTDFYRKPNSLAFVPAGCGVFSSSPRGGEYLTLKCVGRSRAENITQHRFLEVVDLDSIYSAQNLRKMLLSGDLVDPLAFEQSAAVLESSVLSAFNATSNESRASTWMTRRRLKLVDELIEDKMDGSLTVQYLAEALGLSAGFFSRALKAAIGKSPHDYIIDRRLYRARALLRSSDFHLSAVALASGFASHAHMTSVFSRRLGMTPSELRAIKN